MKYGYGIGGMIRSYNEITGKEPVPWHFVHHKFHMHWPGIEPETPWWKTGS